MKRTQAIGLGVVLGLAVMAGCGTTSVPSGDDGITANEAGEISELAVAARDAVLAADAYLPTPDAATAARSMMGSGGPGMMWESDSLPDGTTGTAQGDGWTMMRPDGTRIEVNEDGTRTIYAPGDTEGIQVQPGTGGATMVHGQHHGLVVEDPDEGQDGFCYQWHGANDEVPYGPRINVVQNEDGSLTVEMPHRTITVARNDDGTLQVLDDTGAELCQVAVSEDGADIVVTMPGGQELRVTPNEDGSYTVTMPSGATTTVPAPTEETTA